MTALLATVLSTSMLAASAVGVEPPPEFGTDYDDPRTPAPAVVVPDTRHCSVQIVKHGFRNFDPYVSAYTPPAECRGPWSKVVLRMDGAVKGLQYDRIGYLMIGGRPVFRSSTPEPSADGIEWHVEKDVSAYIPVLRSPQQVVMELGNVVNDTYTGVLDITVTLDFYLTGRGAPAARTAAQVLPLADQHREESDLAGTVTVPPNTSRLLAEVYATGSGGGCEEFWDQSAPASTGYSCPDGSPYREVQVLVDGRIAGVALPYPHIYTGGWSNPYLWRPSPAPRAFDIKPLRYDLTPFAGLLTDGRPHAVRIHVAGVPAGQSGWFTLPNFHVWTDPGVRRTTGGLTAYDVGELDRDEQVTGGPGQAGSVLLDNTRTLRIDGWLKTSKGIVRTEVARQLANRSSHSWTAGESHDELDATWRDTSTVRIAGPDGPRTEVSDLTYGKRGFIDFLPHATIPDAYDLTTDLVLTDRSRDTVVDHGRTTLDRRSEETFDGRATWVYGVPRDQRHPRGEQTMRYRLGGDPSYRCFDHTLAAVNGVYTVDRYGC